MAEPIVFQVRKTDSFGNVRIIHAYVTDDDAQKAIAMMRQRSPGRYTVIPVENQPGEHWGINFPGSDPIHTPHTARLAAIANEQPVAVDEVPVVEESVVAPEPAVEPEVLPSPKKATRRKK